MNKLKRNFSRPNYSLLLSLWRPTQLYLNGEGGKKKWGTLSRGFGLRSFRRPEISACFCQLAISTRAEISGRKLCIFQTGKRGGENGRERELTGLSIVHLRTAQKYLLYSSLPMCYLLLINCEGSHSVRLFLIIWRCIVFIQSVECTAFACIKYQYFLIVTLKASANYYGYRSTLVREVGRLNEHFRCCWQILSPFLPER